MLNETIAQTQSYAATLIRDGMRIALAHSITGMSWRTLREIWSAAHGEDAPPPGRMPCDTIAYIKSGQSPMMLATVVSVYLRAEREGKHITAAFHEAWQSAKLSSGGMSHPDINAAWYAVRDVKAGLVSWCYCKNCDAGFIFDTKIAKKNDPCPYCGARNQKLLEVSQ